jgi:hypothetical protein
LVEFRRITGGVGGGVLSGGVAWVFTFATSFASIGLSTIFFSLLLSLVFFAGKTWKKNQE